MLYRRLCEGLNTKGDLVPHDFDLSMFIGAHKAWFISIHNYTEEHNTRFLERGSIAGIKDVIATRLVWDFDDKNNIENARQDAATLCFRLIQKGIPENALKIAFSGKKGFGVEVDITTQLSLAEFNAITGSLGGDLATFDTTMGDAPQLIRVLGSKHDETGLFKTPLTFSQLNTLSIDDIKQMATSIENITEEFNWYSVDLPEEILSLKNNITTKKVVKVEENPEIKELSLEGKPKFLTNCRWALQNGFFGEGDRSHAYLCLAATYKNIGFSIEHVYRILKGTKVLQQQKHPEEDEFTDEELYNNIVTQVFGPYWGNGQYSCREEGSWLHGYCQSLGTCKCGKEESEALKPKTFLDVANKFKDQVVNIEKNTIITGIKSIDEFLFISTSTNLGILGAPGAGKSAIALNILANTSKMGVPSVFANLDMASTRMFEKACYKVTGLSRYDLYQAFKNNKEQPILDKMKEEFGNVNFLSKTAPTVADIRQYVLNCEQERGEKVKLVMVDYFERVMSEMDDENAGSKRIAGELQDLVEDLNVCLITVVQPRKDALAGGIDSPIYDYTKIKGSGLIYQSMRSILSLWRPFYNPKDFSKDKYMQMAVLKNDFGELGEFQFSWDGKTGEIHELTEFQIQELCDKLQEKEEQKKLEAEQKKISWRS
jgi:hypothetical protein